MEFKELLTKSGLSKRDLARELGLNVNTPSNWGEYPPPYAIAYLRLMEKYIRVRP